MILTLKLPESRLFRRLIHGALGCAGFLLAGLPLSDRLPSVNQSPAYLVAADHQESSDPGSDEYVDPVTVYKEHLLDPADNNQVHSTTLTRLPDGGVRAYWYGGSREGARDVAIYSARYFVSTGQWGATSTVVTREQLVAALGRFVRKLGNPVAFLDERDRVWLFFVSVSVGGWSGSAINYMISEDGGETYGPIRRLVTSPFFNVSTLVRGAPVAMQDGGMTLPIYHEFIGKFAELLVLDPDGLVRTKKRLTWGRHALQPVLVPTTSEEAVVYMRYAGREPRRILYASTHDAGRHFTKARKLALPNPNSAVDAGILPDGELAMIYNPLPRSRNVLSLAVTNGDPARWTRLHDFENAQHQKGRRFSYPTFLRDRQGMFHVAYTFDRHYIKHVTFNHAWLREIREKRGE